MSRLTLIRKLFEDCLDAHHTDGLRFNPEPWQCLMDLVDVPTVRTEAKVCSESEVAYVEALMEEVQGVLESAQSRIEQEEEMRRRAQVQGERESEEKQWEKNEPRKRARRQAREDAGMFEALPMEASA